MDLILTFILLESLEIQLLTSQYNRRVTGSLLWLNSFRVWCEWRRPDVLLHPDVLVTWDSINKDGRLLLPLISFPPLPLRPLSTFLQRAEGKHWLILPSAFRHLPLSFCSLRLTFSTPHYAMLSPLSPSFQPSHLLRDIIIPKYFCVQTASSSSP